MNWHKNRLGDPGLRIYIRTLLVNHTNKSELKINARKIP